MSMTIEQLAGVADAMHALLVKRADQLANSIDGPLGKFPAARANLRCATGT
jgi:hypothetical protein